MRWRVHGERSIYASRWMRVAVADVELPNGERIEHDVVRLPREASAAVVHDSERGVLLLWRHRFITDSWSWELPGGEIDEGESPEEAAARETLEETGWRPSTMRHVGFFHPIAARVEQTFHVCVAEGAERVGEPADPYEAERVEWVPRREVPRLVARGEIRDGYTLAGLRLAQLQMRFFEDIHAGDVVELGSYQVTREEIVEFAHKYDPQPFHVDEAAARASPFGGLIASGWHTAAIFMRLYVDAVLSESASMGSPGVEELRWLHPVRPGDVLSGRSRVVDTSPSRKRPDRGTVISETEIVNQDGEVVMTMRARGFFRRRSG